MQWQWIEDDAQLKAVLARHADYGEVAVDTEFRRRDTYFPQVALLQLCWSDVAYLIDPTRVSELSGIRELLSNTAVIKYLHSASEDLEVFERWLGLLPAPLFDTQRAAGLLGMDAGLSYRALVLALTGVEVPKDETQSDWLKRPLSDAQLRYAALDVVHLLEVGRLLRATAIERERLDWIFEDGARMAPGGRGPLAKFKSAWKLSRGQQLALAALVDWREQRARERDKPRSWILDDKTLAAIAARRPDSMAGLAAVDGVPDGVVRRQGKVLLSVLRAADEGEFLSNWVPAKPLSRAQKEAMKSLASVRDELAEGLGVAGEVLAGNRELEALLREGLGELTEQPPAWQGWRLAAVIEPLRAAVQKQLSGS